MTLIGVSTGQNITNLIPAVQKRVSRYVSLETATARKSGWSKGLREVLERRGIQTRSESLEGFESDIAQMRGQLLRWFEPETQPLLWNLGGGQKPQQIAIWEVFQERNKRGIPDQVCYANQDSQGDLEIWGYADGQLARTIEEIRVELTAQEIFGVFGFEVSGGQKIYERGRAMPYPPTPDLLAHQDFRRFLLEEANHRASNSNQRKFSLDELGERLGEEGAEEEDPTLLTTRELGEQVKRLAPQLDNGLAKLLQTPNGNMPSAIRAFIFGSNKRPSGFLQERLNRRHRFSFTIDDPAVRERLSELLGRPIAKMPGTVLSELGIPQNKTSFYFEKVLIDRVKAELESREGHGVVEAHANLTTWQDGKMVAEYDVLCVTQKGTIVALDAKTFDFEKKDSDARLYNLERGSGYYRSFSAVFPYDFEDLDKDWSRPIRQLPFELDARRLRFYVVSDSRQGSFWVRKGEGGAVEKRLDRPAADEPGWVECRPWQDFLGPRPR